MNKQYNEMAIKISQQAIIARKSILTMTTLSASGHPGGSMSSIDLLLSVYNVMHHDPQNPDMDDRDRLVVSIGHISPAVYSTLGILGYVNLEEAVSHFRQFGSIFEGHIERDVPGVEWSSGNLGQGLSAAVGFAIASKIKDVDYHVYVLMGDGEQQKGQLSEARRFASKYKLSNLTAIVDYNQLQISGSIHEVMPQNIRKNWESDGWQVIEVNGHDIPHVLCALDEAKSSDLPVMILAHTVMGKGISFMENQAKYHGSTLSIDQYEMAMKEMGQCNDFDTYKVKRIESAKSAQISHLKTGQSLFKLEPGKPILYEAENDCRSAWGNAITELGRINFGKENPIVVVDCDLASSVKTSDFRKELPNMFLQSGIMEHHAAVMGGAISTCGVQCFWSDFGVFGIDETYNMQRLNDINHTNLKTILTHVGIDVGEDGKTHQCIDYISLTRNLFDTKIVCPADANHTDRIIRWLIDKPGNYIVAMGRSKLPILKTPEGEIHFGLDYCFNYGIADVLRIGNQGTVFVCGTPAARTLRAIDSLREEGIFLQLVYVSCPLDLDQSIIEEAATKGVIFTIEDHSIHGGLGTSVAEMLVRLQLRVKLVKIGLDGYPVSGASDDLFKMAGMDTISLVNRFRSEIDNV